MCPKNSNRLKPSNNNGKPLTPEKLNELSGKDYSPEEANEIISQIEQLAEIIYQYTIHDKKGTPE